MLNLTWLQLPDTRSPSQFYLSKRIIYSWKSLLSLDIYLFTSISFIRRYLALELNMLIPSRKLTQSASWTSNNFCVVLVCVLAITNSLKYRWQKWTQYFYEDIISIDFYNNIVPLLLSKSLSQASCRTLVVSWCLFLTLPLMLSFVLYFWRLCVFVGSP